MLSYLKTAQQLTSQNIYHRGIKMYLDGCVEGWDSAHLPDWRIYTVIGSQDEYEITFPLLHILLKNDPNHTLKAFKQHVRCTCPYYLEYGTPCKHIVAASADLDHELEKQKTKRIDNVDGSAVIDQVFEYDIDNNKRVWKQLFEDAIYNGTQKVAFSSDLSHMITTCAQEPLHYKDFMEQFIPLIDQRMGRYAHEKILVDIIRFSISIDTKSDVWWKYWKEYIKVLDTSLQVQLMVGFWKLTRIKPSYISTPALMRYIKRAPQELQQKVLTILQKSEAAGWDQYPLETGMEYWLIEHIQEFDPYYLIKVAHVVPDEYELIERELQKHVKAWSDYLQTKNIKDMLDILEAWRIQFGQTHMYEETVDYVLSSHPKKRSLQKALK